MRQLVTIDQELTGKEMLQFAKDFHKKYYMSMFSEIGYHSLRGGGWAIFITSMIGNTTVDNYFLNFKPVLDNDVTASNYVNIFCLINKQFKNRGHIEGYDNLPY